MNSEGGKQKQGRRKRGDMTLLSRRVFLSSVAAMGAAGMWPVTLRATGGLPQENAASPAPARPALPPPAGQEASYLWYVGQYPDPTMFTPVGLPADPAETAVSPHGDLVCACDLIIQGTKYKDVHIPGTQYARNSLAFALFEEGKIVPMGTGEPVRQSLENGYFPVVVSLWKHRDLEIRQTTFSEPLKGEYQSGLESTLAWAVFEVTNHSKATSPVTLLAAQMGDEKNLKRALTNRGSVVLENGSALLSAQIPAGFTVEFHPVFPPRAGAVPEADPLEYLRSQAGVFNALAVRGKVGAGQTVQIVFNRRFDFPAAWHWGPSPQDPVAAEELTGRSPAKALESARATWSALSRQVYHFETPDDILNHTIAKAMLDGYFLTKRWNGQYIVFDSVCYRCQWDDTSTKWFYALDLMGDHATSEHLLDTVFARQGQRKPAGTRTHEGCFSDVTNIERDGSGASWACCNGWALWAMSEHARLAHDPAWFQKHKQKILDGCEWIRRERQFSKEQPGNPCAGLLYGKFVSDMPDQGTVSGVGYFVYTDAISYMGLHAIGALLSEWGHPEGAALLEEAELYRTDIIAAIDRLTDKSQDPWYIPWVLHAPKYVQRYFYDAAGPINLAFGGVLPDDDERIGHVIRWIIDRTHHGSVEDATAGMKPDYEGGMFYSQDLAVVLLELGRVEDFLRVFYTLLAANISHETLTTCEWRSNTQPHAHSISALIRMFRTMMIQEREGRLYLLQGTPRRWMEQGKSVKITQAPTWYGAVSLEVTSNLQAGEVRMQLSLPERIGSTPVHLRLRLPEGRRIEKAQVNGRAHSVIEGEWIVLQGVTGKAEVVATTV